MHLFFFFVVANASQADQAIAIGCLYLFRSLGSVVGISISAAVIQQALRHQLQRTLRNETANNNLEDIIRHVRESLESIDLLEPKVQGIVRLCYEQATRWSFGIDFFLVIGAIVMSLRIREISLIR